MPRTTRADLHALIDQVPDRDLDATRDLIDAQLGHHRHTDDVDERRRRLLANAGGYRYPPGYLDSLRAEWPA